MQYARRQPFRLPLMAAIGVAFGIQIQASLRPQDFIARFDGERPGDQFGSNLAKGDDIDGDGELDLIVGYSAMNQVRVYSIRSGQLLWQWTGEAAGDAFGEGVDGAGDVDKDGCPDVLVGAPNAIWNGERGGRSYVYSGRTGALLFSFGGEDSIDYFGQEVAGIGDANADTYPDHAVGAPHADANRTFGGTVYVYSGADGSLLFRKDATANSALLGDALAGVGDLDSDGCSDLLVGAPGFASHHGIASVFSGRTGDQLLQLTHSAGGSFGSSVDSAGDLDHDGIPDLLVGAPLAKSGVDRSGMAHIFSGRDASLLHTFAGDEVASAFFGSQVAHLADVDADGFPDWIISDPNALHGNIGVAGRVFVYSGRQRELLYEFFGLREGDQFGSSVGGMGDVDQDGFPDLAFGARNPYLEPGAVSVYSATPRPKIFKVTPARGHYLSQARVEIVGLHFTRGDNLEVRIGDQSATNIQVLDDETLRCDVAPDSPGPKDVIVLSSLGSNASPNGFTHSPAIVVDAVASLGEEINLKYLCESGDGLLAIAGIPPPVSISTPPFDGNLCVVPFYIYFFLPFWPATELELELHVPDDPALRGIAILFQALIGPELQGPDKKATWTNCALVSIE